MGSVQVGAAGPVEAGALVDRTPPPEAGDVARQLASHAARLAVPRNPRLRVQLRPQALGSLDLRLAIKEGKLTLEIVAESSRTRDLIAAALPQLQEALAQRSIEVGRLSLAVGGGMDGSAGWAASSPDPFGSPGRWEGGERQPGPGRSLSPGPEREAAGAGAETRDGGRLGHHLVDYRV